ncbi:ankyrin repeat-containing protein NPR4-like [Diospyros lotus]|uniref:ankyrin repeat-containing protein NPR4-like n=1 Tax=Diospyros lotus TaxID=55363 RepID=UPI0022521F01|nr:ankyrin repeat-containing protein NPR4-like [Diospyros lotus]
MENQSQNAKDVPLESSRYSEEKFYGIDPQLEDLIFEIQQQGPVPEANAGDRKYASDDQNAPNAINPKQKWFIRRRTSHRTMRTTKLPTHPAAGQLVISISNRIILVAALVAVVAFTAGISPPGGVYREGELAGKAIAGETKAFKVFSVCNHVALFLSLLIVLIMITLVPTVKRVKHYLYFFTVIMWLAVSSMAAAYVAAIWVVLPQEEYWTMHRVVVLTGFYTLLLSASFVCGTILRPKVRKLLGIKSETDSPQPQPITSETDVEKGECIGHTQ